MLTTNLLPQSERKEIKREEIRRLVLFLSTIIVLVLIIGDVLLVPSFLPIYLQERQLSSSYESAQNFSQSIDVKGAVSQEKNLESKIGTIQKIFDNSGKSTRIFSVIFGGVNGITFSDVEIRNSDEVTIDGHTDTRQSLLNYEDFLRNSGIFQDISSPISNIVRETDFNFSLQAKLKPLYAF